jgi:hypothetical protein
MNNLISTQISKIMNILPCVISELTGLELAGQWGKHKWLSVAVAVSFIMFHESVFLFAPLPIFPFLPFLMSMINQWHPSKI